MSYYHHYYRFTTKKEQTRSSGISLTFTGIVMIMAGFMTTIFTSAFGIFSFLGTIILIGPIILFCVGFFMLPIGIYLLRKASKMPEEKPKEPVISISIPQGTPVSQKKGLSILTCPACGAPLENKPPCKCSYCQRFIE